jgi:plastocyanin
MSARPWSTTAAAAAIACVTALFGGGCISERSEGPTGPVGGTCSIPADALGPDKLVVPLRNFAFLPDTIRVSVGTTVTWVNCEVPGNDAHTSTADGGAWASGFIVRGATFARVFAQAGTFDYHCEPHPFMTGTVIVE